MNRSPLSRRSNIILGCTKYTLYRYTLYTLLSSKSHLHHKFNVVSPEQGNLIRLHTKDTQWKKQKKERAYLQCGQTEDDGCLLKDLTRSIFLYTCGGIVSIVCQYATLIIRRSIVILMLSSTIKTLLYTVTPFS